MQLGIAHFCLRQIWGILDRPEAADLEPAGAQIWDLLDRPDAADLEPAGLPLRPQIWGSGSLFLLRQIN